MLDRLDKESAFGREALDVRAYRQELLSSNIANADTPGYKAHDVDFSTALAGALKQNGAASNTSTLAMAKPVSVSTSGGLAVTAQGHMSDNATFTASGGTTDDYGKLQYRVPSQLSLDGNTMDLDAERVQFADNSLYFEAGMMVLSSQIKSMLSGITSNS